MRIRDPIHGPLHVSDQEKAVVDTPYYQRLRHVRQLGFGELAFPGATHTRHAHSLGAMHVASRLFDQISPSSGLPPDVCHRFRAALRLAVLCHDIGHMPLSHASEQIAPQRSTLKLPSWLGSESGQASHEDYTAKLLLDSSLSDVIREQYAVIGVRPEDAAALVTGLPPPGGFTFTHAGTDWTPLLRGLVSGELDADRMDYLLRDSFYTGVNYGVFDFDWLRENLHPAVRDGKANLALSRAAAFAFDDFLLSRYHMFVSVYYHHTAVNYDTMLGRFYREAQGEFEVPADPEAFLECDDVALAVALRKSKNPWAKRIVLRKGYKLLAQFTERDAGYDLTKLTEALDAAHVDHFEAQSRGVLSKYVGEGKATGLYILDRATGRLTEVDRYTPLYERYSGAVQLSCVFVRPEQVDTARSILAKVTRA